MSAFTEELLGKMRAAAKVKGVDWLRETVEEVLKEGKAAEAQDPKPCASRVRPPQSRSPSPVPRAKARVSSPDRDPPGAAAWQCPPSELLCPGRDPFTLDCDSQDLPNAVHYEDEDLRTPYDETSQCSGPSSAVAVTVSMEDDGGSDDDDDSGQHYFSPSTDSQPDLELARNTVEESDAVRIERVLRSCSEASGLDQRKAPSVSVPVGLSPPDHPCLVWILGNSFVSSAMERVSLQPDGRQLGFQRTQVTIRWLGTRGLTWKCVRPTAARYSLLDRSPDVLVVHAGGDDLGSIGIRHLIKDIKFDMLRLQTLFPGSIVIWSEIVNRHTWSQAITQKGIQQARIKVNKGVSKFLTKNGVLVVRHRGLEDGSPHLFKGDGIQLNPAGNDIWCINIQEGIDKALQIWQSLHGKKA
ncbi:uncharacterized protein [Dendropsophus ebraccatus]|uniref:uncharacterized protein n=1 Tax=Dendropsophus ebraccatus TaxID=150705 RepID=UPI0038322FF1